MDFSKDILEMYKNGADKRLSFVCRVMIILMGIVVMLNVVGVFKIDSIALNTAAIFASLIFFLPTLLCDILRKKGEWVRYSILAILVFQVGMLYSLLSYHTILMLSFPIVAACLYNEKKYVIFTWALSIPVIVISHLIALQLKIVPDEPLVTLKGVILYGIVPRIIELTAVSIICIYIARRMERLLDSLIKKNIQLYKDQENIIESLSEIIEYQSVTTGKHVRRVSEYTAVLCSALGYSEEKTFEASVAAMMHDIGKVMVPQEIINKPGKLTNEEFEIIKKHVLYGQKMLERATGEILQLSSIIAYEHHERWNGKGYMGKKGEDINEFARCVSLADVFDALVSKRAYKNAWTAKDAYDEIVAQRGEQFDPKVVDAFIEHFDEFIAIMEKYPDLDE